MLNVVLIQKDLIDKGLPVLRMGDGDVDRVAIDTRKEHLEMLARSGLVDVDMNSLSWQHVRPGVEGIVLDGVSRRRCDTRVWSHFMHYGEEGNVVFWMRRSGGRQHK